MFGTWRSRRERGMAFGSGKNRVGRVWLPIFFGAGDPRPAIMERRRSRLVRAALHSALDLAIVTVTLRT